MALILYGSPQSRTTRVLWMLAELGVPFEHVPVGWDDPFLKTPDFLRINPAGRIPAIVDDGMALSESLAINLYLAKRYSAAGPQGLYPSSPQDEARTWSWTLWATFDLEAALDVIRRHWTDLYLPAAERQPAVADEAAKRLGPALILLDGVLAKTPWLVGDHFSVADLNVAAVLSPSRISLIELGPSPALRDWLARCYARPACIEARQALQPAPGSAGGSATSRPMASR